MRPVTPHSGVIVILIMIIAFLPARVLAVDFVGDFEGRLFGGVDTGVAVPLGTFSHYDHVGGVLSPFIGYKLFADRDLRLNVAPMLQGQFIGFPVDADGRPHEDNTFALAYHAGPRLSMPYGPFELYGTWMAGGISGLTSPSAINRTSWGFSTGGGLNYSVTDNLMIGAFARFNRFYQEVHGGDDVRYVTAGIGVTFQQSQQPPPPPAGVVAAEAAPLPITKRKIVLRGVNFDFDKANIRPDAVPILEQACSQLKQDTNIDVIAEGHTDSIGSEAYNLRLSERRANAVREWLIKCGIAPTRLRAKGFGKSDPVATNATAEGRAQNRRVELVIAGG